MRAKNVYNALYLGLNELKECLYYFKSGYSPFMDKEKYYGCLQILHNRFYSSIKNKVYGKN